MLETTLQEQKGPESGAEISEVSPKIDNAPPIEIEEIPFPLPSQKEPFGSSPTLHAPIDLSPAPPPFPTEKVPASGTGGLF